MSSHLKILNNISFQIFITLVFIILFGSLLPKTIQEFLYTLSLILKSILLSVLPLLIITSLMLSFSTIRGKKVVTLILSLLLVVFISNYISALLAYSIASLDMININIASATNIHEQDLNPLWDITIPELIPTNYALFIGFIAGLLLPLFSNSVCNRLIVASKNFNFIFLEKFFIPILPLFVAGFILKLQSEGILIQCIKYCFPLMLLIVCTYIIYITFLFLIISKFDLSVCKKYIGNSLPAAFVGFSTMSSLAAMPLTIAGAEKNTNNSPISRMVIITTVNIHMIGLAINVPLMALSLLLSFGFPFPSFITYSTLAFYFVLTQFAGAGAPGCSILLMIPLLEKYLGFTGEMSAFITAIYILFDASETSANILGNSALSIAVNKVAKFFKLI